jgi:hypothetical protein
MGARTEVGLYKQRKLCVCVCVCVRARTSPGFRTKSSYKLSYWIIRKHGTLQSIRERQQQIKTNIKKKQEQINSRLNSGNTCYHAVHSLLHSYVLSENVGLQTQNTNFCFSKWMLSFVSHPTWKKAEDVWEQVA